VSFVVTIDGPSAAGKSTAARAAAARLGFLYVDTGALYRALALKLSWADGSPEAPADVERLLAATRIDLSGAPDRPHVWLDGEDVNDRIRSPEVSELSSRLAAIPGVRHWLVGIQRALRERGPLVAEGRDLGTVVFPDAEVKVYLDADAGTRARRRAAELRGRGLEVHVKQVLESIQRRDQRDRTRADSPLRPAPGAVVIESSGRDAEAVVEEVLRIVRAHPACPSGGPPGAPGTGPGSGAGPAGSPGPGMPDGEPVD
jgi:CMP/dCMP kinase